MLLLPEELLFGVAPEILVDCARQLHARDGRSFALTDFCEALGAPIGEASSVLGQMLAHGFFKVDECQTDQYSSTIKLGQLALANISNGVPRAAAAKLMKRVVEKAKWINSDPDRHACRVTCVAVFGSYLTDKAVLGDLDIGVEIFEIRKAERLAHRGIRKLMQGGSTPSSRAMAALRLQKPKQISIHLLSEVIDLGTSYEVVFGERTS